MLNYTARGVRKYSLMLSSTPAANDILKVNIFLINATIAFKCNNKGKFGLPFLVLLWITFTELV